jgi:hypothetical protein
MKTDPPAPLLIFFASRQIGGGEAYFINLGLAAIRAGRRCVVVDYAAGYVVTRIPGAEHIIYTDEGGADFHGDCIAFMPIGAATFLGGKLRLNPRARILLVSIHHNHAIELGNWGWLLRRLSPAAAGFVWPLIEPLRHRTVRRFFQDISQLKGLVYCAPFQKDFDEAYLGCALAAQVVPIPLTKTPTESDDAVGEGRAIVWVSRFVKEKADIIDEIIAELKSSKLRHKLILIGEGSELPRMKASANKAGIDYEMPGVISGANLARYLRRHAHLCVGVGTAAAEMAAAGLPTLAAGLPGANAGRYVWFHQATPGDTIVTAATCDRSILLTTALEQINPANKRQEIAAKCADAAIRHHDIKASWEKLVRSLDETELEALQLIQLTDMKQQPFCFIRHLKNKFKKLAKPDVS